MCSEARHGLSLGNHQLPKHRSLNFSLNHSPTHSPSLVDGPQEYVDATVPKLAFGEFWDACSYSDGVLSYNQDEHRQRTVDWCDRTGGTTAAFDFTTKGILQEAIGRNELWRLVDSQGRPPGMLGLWPSRAVTFIDNHDTGSTLNHWPFPWEQVRSQPALSVT